MGLGVSYERGTPVAVDPPSVSQLDRHTNSSTFDHTVHAATTLDVTQGQILSQPPVDSVRFWWQWYGS